MVAGAFPLNRDEAPPTAQISGGWGSAVQAPKGCAPPETPLVGTEQPCDPAIPLADVYPKEVKTTQKEACVPMFIAASFTTNQDAEITWVSVSGQVERDMPGQPSATAFLCCSSTSHHLQPQKDNELQAGS